MPCEINEDCNEVVTGATCSVVLGGYCTCAAGYTFSTDASRCLKGSTTNQTLSTNNNQFIISLIKQFFTLVEASYGESCAEAIQCSHML